MEKNSSEMNAWLVTWEGTERNITDKNRLVAILSSKRSHSFIEDMVDSLYLMSNESAYSASFYANRKGKRRGRFKVIGTSSIIYGNNPFLYARIVSDLQVIKNDSTMSETVSWVEPAKYELSSETGYKPKLLEESKLITLTRPSSLPLLQCI